MTRKTNYLAQLQARRDATKTPEPVPEPATAPEPKPTSEFTDPAVALEDLRDQLSEVRRERDSSRARFIASRWGHSRAAVKRHASECLTGELRDGTRRDLYAMLNREGA